MGYSFVGVYAISLIHLIVVGRCRSFLCCVTPSPSGMRLFSIVV